MRKEFNLVYFCETVLSDAKEEIFGKNHRSRGSVGGKNEKKIFSRTSQIRIFSKGIVFCLPLNSLFYYSTIQSLSDMPCRRQILSYLI